MSEELRFPIKSLVLRRHMMRHDMRCPECGGQMDVGYECNECRFDGLLEMDAARAGEGQ